MASLNCQRFSFEDISRATNQFDEQKLIGEGGFGRVFKARFLNNPKFYFIFFGFILRIQKKKFELGVEILFSYYCFFKDNNFDLPCGVFI